VAEDRAIQLIESLVVETFGDIPGRVPQVTLDAQDGAGNGIALNPIREGITGGSAVGQGPCTSVPIRTHNDVGGFTEGGVAQIDVVEVRA